MQQQTPESYLENCIDHLNSIIEESMDDDLCFKLREKRNLLSKALEKLVVENLNHASPEFNDALESLSKTSEELKACRVRIENKEHLLSNITKTIGKVENLIGKLV